MGMFTKKVFYKHSTKGKIGTNWHQLFHKLIDVRATLHEFFDK